MCLNILPTCTYVYHMFAWDKEVKRGCWIPWTRSYKWFLATVSVMGTEPVFTARAKIFLTTSNVFNSQRYQTIYLQYLRQQAAFCDSSHSLDNKNTLFFRSKPHFRVTYWLTVPVNCKVVFKTFKCFALDYGKSSIQTEGTHDGSHSWLSLWGAFAYLQSVWRNSMRTADERLAHSVHSLDEEALLVAWISLCLVKTWL